MPTVILQRHETVLEIVLNRPEVLNTANRELIAELAAATSEAAEDRAARVVLLRGAGTHFCAGGDITMFGELIGLSPAERRKARTPSTKSGVAAQEAKHSASCRSCRSRTSPTDDWISALLAA